MSKVNENRQGYKKTKVGWIPVEWNVTKLDKISEYITKGSTPTTYGYDWSDDKGGIPFLRSECVGDSGFKASGLSYISRDAHDFLRRSEIKADDILMTITGNVGRVIKLPESYSTANINQHIAKIRINDINVSNDYIYQQLSLPYYKKEYQRILTGQAYPQISLKQVRDTRVPLPPLQEQKKIAEILSTWDNAIEKLEKLIELKEQRKKGLMQQLLTGKKRLPGFGKPVETEGEVPEGWTLTAFKEFLRESRIIGSKGDVAKKITVKLYGNGVVPKQEKLVGSKETQFYRRKTGQFIYSKLDFINGAFGLIPETLNDYESSLDLPAFDIDFTKVNPIFFIHFVIRRDFYKKYIGLASGGRKARRVKPKNLLEIKEPLPSINEQYEISKIIEIIRKDLTHTKALLDYHKTQKKGLMQKLLTGEVRVRTKQHETADVR